jgi:hypothetical protein
MLPTTSYLRRPQTVVYRDSYGNIVDPPRSISSAISMTRQQLQPEVVHELHCVADEKAVDLEELCQLSLGSTPTNDNHIPLFFDIVSEDGGRYR